MYFIGSFEHPGNNRASGHSFVTRGLADLPVHVRQRQLSSSLHQMAHAQNRCPTDLKQKDGSTDPSPGGFRWTHHGPPGISLYSFDMELYSTVSNYIRFLQVDDACWRGGIRTHTTRFKAWHPTLRRPSSDCWGARI